jgi:hypothetical protein
MGETAVDKNRVVAAVERYLAQRGLAAAPSPTAEIVDRFLAKREEPVAAAEPKQATVDFVCENDVRDAIRSGKKIYICAKCIVTPAARDLAGQQREEILIMTRSDKTKAGKPATDY